MGGQLGLRIFLRWYHPYIPKHLYNLTVHMHTAVLVVQHACHDKQLTS